MAARTSSAEHDAPAEYSPAGAGVRGYLEAWKARLAETGWTPWLILGLAAFLRFFLLGIKPPHFDEGINGWFVDQVMHNGFYRYDPTNYHGPLHFYVLLLSESLFGRNIWALRLPVDAGEHWLRLADVEVRAVSRAKREPNSSVGHGGFSRICVLRPVRDSRSVAAILLDDVHPRAAWPLEIGNVELSLVCRDGNSRHDSD